jgi:hypothetical protein
VTDSWSDQLDLLIRARTPILWIRSLEEERVDGLLEQAAQRLGGRTLLRWDFIDGLSGAPNRSGEATRNPMAALACLDPLPPEQGALLVLRAESLTVAQASEVWRRLGCRVRELAPALHDQALAAVSHFPHMMAFAFMHSLMAQPEGEQFLALGGPGFRDSTRIAAGDADLWCDVLLATSGPVLAQAQGLRRALAELEGMVQRQDRPALRGLIAQVSQRRADWRMAGDIAPPPPTPIPSSPAD